MLTWLDEYRRNPMGANPYFVLTCFDELLAKKEIALLRGDVISHMTQSEGQVLMTQIIEHYLNESKYDTVRKFNTEPERFDF